MTVACPRTQKEYDIISESVQTAVWCHGEKSMRSMHAIIICKIVRINAFKHAMLVSLPNLAILWKEKCMHSTGRREISISIL